MKGARNFMKDKIISFSIIWMLLVGCTSNPITGNMPPIEAAMKCVNKSPQGEFVEDGHLYTTLSISEITKYLDLRKMTISYYSQYPDIDLDYEAVPVSLKYLLVPWEWEWRNDITGSLHSLHGGKRVAIDERRNNIKNSLASTLKDHNLDWLSGLIIHAYADSFAHTKNSYGSNEEEAYGVWIGHAIPSMFGNSPDDIKKEDNEPKYLGYIDHLYNTFKTDNENQKEFDEFKDYVDKLNCDGGKCPNFHALFYDDIQAGKRVVKFTECMNKNSRKLTVFEVQRAMNLISGKVSLTTANGQYYFSSQ